MADEIISREDARAQGLKNYFSGIPCRKGHLSKRNVKYGHCMACNVERTKAFRADNPGWDQRISAAWRDKNREKIRAQYRERYAKDPQKYVGKTKRYYLNNGESVRERRKEYHHQRQSTSPEYRNTAVQRTQKWAEENREARRAQLQKQKAKRRAVAGSYTGSDIIEILKLQKGRCAYCRMKLEKYQVDHIVAVANGGTNFRRNVQIACGPCNRAKSAKDPIDYARSLGKLL